MQPTGMLLHVKGNPVKALCCQCWHLFAPTAQELESAAAGMLVAYVCAKCKAPKEMPETNISDVIRRAKEETDEMEKRYPVLTMRRGKVVRTWEHRSVAAVN